MQIEYLNRFKTIEPLFSYEHPEHLTIYKLRENLTQQFSWAIPTREALDLIKQYSPILEIGAGTGYWAFLLESLNCDILPVDIEPPNKRANKFGHKKEYTSVIKGDQNTVKLFPECNVFICWPYMDNTAYTIALDMQISRYLIYIGEGHGGCNANNSFFDYLSDNFNQVVSHDIPQWDGIHDRLNIYQKVNT